MFWNEVVRKRRNKQLTFFNWLANVKNLVLPNGSKHVRNVINDINTVFFSKIAHSLWRLEALPPDPCL